MNRQLGLQIYLYRETENVKEGAKLRVFLSVDREAERQHGKDEHRHSGHGLNDMEGASKDGGSGAGTVSSYRQIHADL